MIGSYLDCEKDQPDRQERYTGLKQALEPLRHLLSNRVVLDFGASRGLSTCALIELGAAKVVGVEPDKERVCRGGENLRKLEITHQAMIVLISYTGELPFADKTFDVVFANAVLEHIVPPRKPILRELWRVLLPGGYLIINESPNKYLPIDLHTTKGLMFVPWLPCRIARSYAVCRGRFRRGAEWATSGWRGIGYYEITGALSSAYTAIPAKDRRGMRHRILAWLRLPSNLLDPYPVLIFQKTK